MAILTEQEMVEGPREDLDPSDHPVFIENVMNLLTMLSDAYDDARKVKKAWKVVAG